MTAPVNLYAANPADGCTGCGSQDTEWLHPHLGRRCASCPPWLSLPAPAGFVALRAWLTATINDRFASVTL